LNLDKNAKNQPIIISKINLDNPFTNNKNNNFQNANYNNLEDKELIKRNFEENRNQKDIQAYNNNNILNTKSQVNTNKNDNVQIENFEERLDKLLSKHTYLIIYLIS